MLSSRQSPSRRWNWLQLKSNLRILSTAACMGSRCRLPALIGLKVDDKYHEWPKAHITGTQLLHLAGRDGQLVFAVFENFRHGEPELISPHAEADLRKHGVEKFTTAPKLVQVTIDGKHKPIQAGTYTVTELKRVLGVDPSRVLDEVMGGEFKELPDNGTVHIKGGEIFVSHVRQGQSS